MKIRRVLAGLSMAAMLCSATPVMAATSPATTDTVVQPATELEVKSNKTGAIKVEFEESVTQKVVGYKIKVVNAKGKVVKVVYTEDPSVTIKGLNSGKYSVRVKAYKVKKNGTKVYSKRTKKTVVVK